MGPVSRSNESVDGDSMKKKEGKEDVNVDMEPV